MENLYVFAVVPHAGTWIEIDKKYPEYNVFAEFKITHSKWMIGTWEENLNYFYSKCLEFLEDEGLIEENPAGFKFLKDGCME